MTVHDTARANMVESQIRPNGVTDLRIVRAMLAVPRELFVPASMRPLAYMDHEVPVRPASREAPARYLTAPMPLARLIQLAEVGDDDLVLDVGCATGYSTAILARLAGAVVGVDDDPTLVEAASRALSELSADNAAAVTGEMTQGYPAEGPYDVIVLGGAVQVVPEALFEQLKDRGRLVAIVAERAAGKATVFERVGAGVSRRAAFDANAPLLPGFERAPAFVF